MTAPLNLRTLDALRGLLAVYVLAGHCRWLLWCGHAVWMAAPHARWLEPIVYGSASLRYGREAVMVFFVLSGFFIHLRAARPGAIAAEPALDFYRRRAHRLGAPYYFALLATVALDAVGRALFPTLYLASTGDSLTDGVFRQTGYSLQSVAPAAIVLPSSLGRDFGTNVPLWSLAYEVVYYAIYPVWLAVRRRSAVLAFVVVPLACFALLSMQLTFLGVVMLHYPIWLAGAALAEGLSRGLLSRSHVAAAVVFIAGFALHSSGTLTWLPTMPALLYGAAAVFAFATMSGDAMKRWPVRLFEYLGVRSYSIYILHFPLVALMSAALFEAGGRPMHGWFAIGGAVVAVAFGCAGFAVCERYFVHHRIPGDRLKA
jgi:peptidoglycan/LPS O-acetylase OafA/YrhL